LSSRDIAIINRLLNTDVKKATALIHFQRSLSLNVQRIMTLAIFNAQENKPDARGFYYISVQLVMDLCGWESSNNYERIYDYFRELRATELVWNFLEEDRTLDEIRSSFFEKVGRSKRRGIVAYKFPDELMPLIDEPTVYARLKLIMLSLLAKPKYAYPIYELVADTHSRGLPYIDLTLDRFKEYLGIPAASYTDYVTLKDQVIKPSLKTINALSDYTLTLGSPTRTSRRITGIRLIPQRKAQWQQSISFDKPIDALRRHLVAQRGTVPAIPVPTPDGEAVSSLMRMITTHGVDAVTARAAISTYGVISTREILEGVEADIARRNKSGNPVLNPPAYIAHCLRNGFGVLSPSDRVNAERARAERNTIQQERQADGLLSQINADANEAWRGDIDHKIWALASAELDELKREFENRIVEGKYSVHFAAEYERRKWNTSGVKTFFRLFVAERLAHPSIENYEKDLARKMGYDLEKLKSAMNIRSGG